MIGEPHRCLDGFGTVNIVRRSPFDQHDGQAEDAGGDDFPLCGLAAGILADDHVDAVFLQQRHLRFHGEGSAGQQIVGIRYVQRRIDGIDAAHEIMVLRRRVENLRLLPADRKEDAARRFAERRHGFGDRADARPAVALGLRPAGALQPKQRHAGRFARRARIGGNLLGEGVCGVDEKIDALFREIGREPGNAAETAAAHRRGLRCGIERAAGERQDDRKIGPAGKRARKVARLGRAAQNKDASFVHA